jgi:U3 small nucleolar RNA-associated protein 13
MKFIYLNKLIGHHGEVLDIAICSKDGSLIAVATNSELIKIYNTNDWNCQLLKGHTDIVICLNSYYKSKTSYLLSSSKDSTIRLWKQECEESQIFKEIGIARGHTQDVGSICFSKLDFKFFVSASIDTTIKLWNINENTYELKVLFTQKAHDKDINSVCVSPNDKYLASGSSDKVAKLWDATNGECLGVFKGHKRGIWCVVSIIMKIKCFFKLISFFFYKSYFHQLIK